MTYLEKEIYSQPKVLKRLLSQELPRVTRLAARIRKSGKKTIFLVARGSSDNAGVYGKYLFGSRNGLVVALATPSLFTLYKKPPDVSDCLFLAISQSGESEDLCQVVEEGRRQGAQTIVITNNSNSPLSSIAQDTIRLHAGRERSVAATKTYTAELLALAMLSTELRGNQKEKEILRRVPEICEKIINKSKNVSQLAERYRYINRLSVIGRGYNYATAFELSLKIKELAYIPAEPSSSADFRHGPIAIVEEGFPVMLIAPSGKTQADLFELAQSLKERQAELLVVSENRKMLSMATTKMPISAGLPEWLSPLATVIPGQLFAMGLAMARNCPIDKPRGLRKVTNTC
jgi:glucosamine--fructose-6-phosphate aminotransferase (isomerizing)